MAYGIISPHRILHFSILFTNNSLCELYGLAMLTFQLAFFFSMQDSVQKGAFTSGYIVQLESSF